MPYDNGGQRLASDLTAPVATTDDHTDATTDIHHPMWTPNHAPTTTTTEPCTPIKMTTQPQGVRDNAAAGHKLIRTLLDKLRQVTCQGHVTAVFHSSTPVRDLHRGAQTQQQRMQQQPSCGGIVDDDDGAAPGGIGGEDRDGDGDSSRDSNCGNGDTDAAGDNGDAGGNSGSTGVVMWVSAWTVGTWTGTALLLKWGNETATNKVGCGKSNAKYHGEAIIEDPEGEEKELLTPQ
ncbi:hypothetical protein EDB85DRAFT_1900941 [Lactarius pseudohatsudake]|nr:hypothetical protein EDB85DRAFT_1900941 [Lactarius pseudohatsudake]